MKAMIPAFRAAIGILVLLIISAAGPNSSRDTAGIHSERLLDAEGFDGADSNGAPCRHGYEAEKQDGSRASGRIKGHRQEQESPDEPCCRKCSGQSPQQAGAGQAGVATNDQSQQDADRIPSGKKR